MHGNTGNLGMEDSCYHHSIRLGKMIKLVRVGHDETLGGFTYISLTPEGSPTIEFGQVTPDTKLTTVFMRFELVGFESTFIIDPEDASERLISFQLLVNTCT